MVGQLQGLILLLLELLLFLLYVIFEVMVTLDAPHQLAVLDTIVVDHQDLLLLVLLRVRQAALVPAELVLLENRCLVLLYLKTHRLPLFHG
mmetsp:Transcript_2281/g.2221  ORF Transcript_2281/g.2221 Transcript_2281/m.2221 type:complete len:91 (-) Transcript_2281:1239-1511(-)